MENKVTRQFFRKIAGDKRRYSADPGTGKGTGIGTAELQSPTNGKNEDQRPADFRLIFATHLQMHSNKLLYTNVDAIMEV